ncbi:MAG: hypothetical protein GEU79_00700 [Acidimicrobiia bacterium]|nr:hypothetical protein [Acidimicrobiia bacterium]
MSSCDALMDSERRLASRIGAGMTPALVPALLFGYLVAGSGGCLVVLVVMLLVPQVRVHLSQRRRRILLRSAAPEVARVVLIALHAGQPPVMALATAARYLDPAVSREIRAVLRRAATTGSEQAFAQAKGPLSSLFSSLARAQVTGASVSEVVRGQVEEGRRERRRLIREHSQKMAIRLMIPVTLLILPGFVVMTYGPMVISVLTDTLGSLESVTP